MTYDYQIGEYSVSKAEASPFQLYYTDDEYSDIISLCKKTFGRDFTNETCVRLDSCLRSGSKVNLSFSKVHFYDFLATNYLFFNYNKLYENSTPAERSILTKFYREVSSQGLNSFHAIIDQAFFSNIIAVSLLIHDDTRYLLTKRSSNVGIANDFLSTSVTGSVDADDFEQEDPIISCCQRELTEELNYSLSSSHMKLSKIVCGEKKVQPIALVSAHIDNIEPIIHAFKTHKGFFDENSGYHLCSKNELAFLLTSDRVSITEAARTQLEDALHEITPD